MTCPLVPQMRTQDLALFEELQGSAVGPLSLTLQDPTPGTIGCLLGGLSEPLVRKYFISTVHPDTCVPGGSGRCGVERVPRHRGPWEGGAWGWEQGARTPGSVVDKWSGAGLLWGSGACGGMAGSLGAGRSAAGVAAAGTLGPWEAVLHDPRCLGFHSIRGKRGGRAGTPGSVQGCAALALWQDPPAPHGIAGAGTWLHGTRAAVSVSPPDLVKTLTLRKTLPSTSPCFWAPRRPAWDPLDSQSLKTPYKCKGTRVPRGGQRLPERLTHRAPCYPLGFPVSSGHSGTSPLHPGPCQAALLPPESLLAPGEPAAYPIFPRTPTVPLGAPVTVS